MSSSHSKENWQQRAEKAESLLIKEELRSRELEESLLNNLHKLLRIVDLPPKTVDTYLDKLKRISSRGADTYQIESLVKEISEAVVVQDSSPQKASVVDPVIMKTIHWLAVHAPKESGAAIELHSFVRQLNAALNVEQYLRTLDEVKSFLLDLINHDFEMEGKYSRLIVHLLHQLFERLSLPREMQQDVDKLRTLIEQGYNPKSWSKVLDTIDVVTTDFRKKLYTEREDIEHFLIEITNRLKELELFVKKSAEYSEHALEKGKEFNDSMVFELNGIGRSLANTMDLDNLKDEISSRLEAIEFRLNLFWEEDNVRHETTREQVRSLIGLLNNMDAEASQLRLRMKRQRMEAMIDPLTAVANRLSYNDKIRDEIARAKRYGEPLCLVVWDIDYFKKINDRYGHVAGDNALKSVAKLLSQRIRETDYIARYGGEEFVLLLPSTRIPNAVESCNQIRELVEEAKFHFQGERIAITLSAGIAEFSAGDTPESLFNRADEALYRAKEEGRNRVVTAI